MSYPNLLLRGGISFLGKYWLLRGAIPSLFHSPNLLLSNWWKSYHRQPTSTQLPEGKAFDTLWLSPLVILFPRVYVFASFCLCLLCLPAEIWSGFSLTKLSPALPCLAFGAFENIARHWQFAVVTHLLTFGRRPKLWPNHKTKILEFCSNIAPRTGPHPFTM